MIDPSLPLQAAIVAALKTEPVMIEIVADNVFDAVPGARAKPYVNLGQPQVLPDKADCLDGAITRFPIHGWCDGPKSVAIKRLGNAIASTLDDNLLTVEGHRVVNCEVEQVQYLDDPDVNTKHVAVMLEITTEPI